MDMESDNAPKIAGIKNNIKVKQQRLIRIENQIMKSQGKSKEEIQEQHMKNRERLIEEGLVKP